MTKILLAKTRIKVTIERIRTALRPMKMTKNQWEKISGTSPSYRIDTHEHEEAT